MKRCDFCGAILSREDLIRSAAQRLFAPICQPCDALRKERAARYLLDALPFKSEAVAP